MTRKSPNQQAVQLNAVRSLASHELKEVRDFVDLSERLLKKELEALSARIHEKTSCRPLPDREFKLGWCDDDIYQLSEVFPRIQRYSLFVSIIGMIEHHLQYICRQAKRICHEELAASDLNGKGLVRSIDYLIKVCHFRISRNSGSQMHHLKIFQKMRNAIVHNDGRPSGGDLTAIKQYRKGNPHFEVTERDQIVLSGKFLITVIHNADLLFRIIFGELKKRM